MTTTKISTTKPSVYGAGTQVVTGSAKLLLGERRQATPVSGKLDSFQQARQQVERLVITITDSQTIKAQQVLSDLYEAEKSADANGQARPRATRGQAQATALLFRACLPHALLQAVEGAKKCDSFEQSWNAALAALHTAIRRWEPSKGLKLQSFVKAVLPGEFEKERQASQVLDKSDWEAASVSAVMNRILDEQFNQPWTTWFSDAQGSIINVNPDQFTKPIQGIVFPEMASVTYDGRGRIVNGQPMTTTESRVVKVKGKSITKEVKVAVANPMLGWLSDKNLSVRVFSEKGLNKLRKTARAKTGIKVTDVTEAGKAMVSNLRKYPKFSARTMIAKIARKPLRPIRREEITPRMVQMGMRTRRSSEQGFDERKWSVFRIAEIMSRLAQVMSYDVTISDDEGDETRMSDFLASPEAEEVDEYEISKEKILGFMAMYGIPMNTPVAAMLSRDDLTPELVDAIAIVAQNAPRVTGNELDIVKPEFDPEALADAQRLTERLQQSGLYELAIDLPVHKFLQAHEQSRAAFAALCSTYGVRVKHALQLVNAINATMR